MASSEGWGAISEKARFCAHRVHGDARTIAVILWSTFAPGGEAGMPKRSNEFQRLVAMLTMLKSDGATVHESVEVMEIVSKERREVDVVAFGKVAGHQSAVFIECRDWKRPQDVQWVEQARTKFDDLAREREDSRLVQRIHEDCAGESRPLRNQDDHDR